MSGAFLIAACERAVRCMASCNTNGLLKYYADVILNGDNLISFTQPHNISDNNDNTGRKNNHIMAPRTDPYSVSMPLQINGTSDTDKRSNKVEDESEQSVSIQQIPDSRLSNCFVADNEASSQNSQIGQTSTKVRSQSTFNKLTNYEKTLQNHSSLAQRLTSDSPESQHELLPISSVVGSMLPDLAYEDTESSTDDEVEMDTAFSSSKQSWLYTRSVTHSNWHWLCTEIKRAERCLQKLVMLKYNSYNLEKESESNSSSITKTDAEEVTCSRVSSFEKKKQHHYHNLSSHKCACVIQAMRKSSAGDPHIKCSCIPPFVGPCILCCGSEPDSQLAEISLIVYHIHPKLSIPGDVQLALRLESRLAAYSSVHFRPHKATVRSIQPWEKPNCLQPLNFTNSNPTVSSRFEPSQSTETPSKCQSSRPKNSRLRKRKLVSSKSSKVCSSRVNSTKLLRTPARYVQSADDEGESQ
ncbi:unnamed protein product [Heterobilharzia americana]|nr:unnamed protein product [Heterobilharzia americana]